ncbi:MAG TPA: TlpA disulfide reductase family protein [Sandaracinaceae bacterium LLY-WYZ-13_1]|nr:TlpA disulfide reductase family protein [Sandaracinaceae bacterium LLY-WYZ-13_1]
MSERGSRSWVVIALVAVGFVGMAIGVAKLLGYDPTGGPRSAIEGRSAPEVSLPLVAGEGASDGDRVSVAGLQGTVVLLDFWASWCGPCRRSIPALNQVHERYHDRVRFFGVNVEPGLSATQVREAHADFGANFPTLHDHRQEAQASYGVQSIPTLVLIDRDGVVRHVERGVPDPEAVGEELDRLLEP